MLSHLLLKRLEGLVERGEDVVPVGPDAGLGAAQADVVQVLRNTRMPI